MFHEEIFAPSNFRSTGHELIDLLSDYLESAQRKDIPVLPVADPDELLKQWRLTNKENDSEAEPRPIELLELVKEVLAKSTHLHHPGYVGHQVSVPLPAASLIECVNALLNNGMAVYEMGQIQTAMETNVVELLCREVGFDANSGGILTHGGSIGNFTALLAARQAKAGYDVWTEGQSRPMAVLVSDQAHYCVARSVQSMGWGKKGAWPVSTDRDFRMDLQALESAYQDATNDGRQVVAVVGSACSTSTGSFDPLQEIGAFCRSKDLWFHVDGAHGASMVLSAKNRHKLAGIEMADSVVWDLHKMLGLPALNTAVLFKEKQRSYEAFAQEASYLFDQTASEDQWFNLGQRTMECTKRAMGVTAWCLIRVLGLGWFEKQIDHLIALTEEFAARLKSFDDFEIAHEPETNILCFRHLPSSDINPDELNEHQSRIRAAALKDGSFYLVQTRLGKNTWLRVTLMNPQTSIEDLMRLVEFLRTAA
ncbi:MAG: L-2,4-diaminobutyrate decarboxylase [Planctomycetota bacterium]|jgi:L-2,4-diaminobutyrate decarboxylase